MELPLFNSEHYEEQVFSRINLPQDTKISEIEFHDCKFVNCKFPKVIFFDCMSREIHVRFCEKLGGRFPLLTRPKRSTRIRETSSRTGYLHVEAVGKGLSSCKNSNLLVYYNASNGSSSLNFAESRKPWPNTSLTPTPKGSLYR